MGKSKDRDRDPSEVLSLTTSGVEASSVTEAGDSGSGESSDAESVETVGGTRYKVNRKGKRENLRRGTIAYNQAEIIEREKKRKKLKEQRLVNKMVEMIPGSIIKSDDSRWTIYTLAPFYKFLRCQETEIVVVYLNKMEKFLEENELIWPEEGEVVESQDSLMKNDVPPLISEELIVSNTLLPNNSKQIFYFLKLKQVLVERENFYDDCIFGNISGVVPSLHALQNFVLSPLFRQDGVLPQSAQNDIFSATNNILSSLTETIQMNMKIGKTVLFIPQEVFTKEVKVASKDKEFCARIEGEMVHWIRQLNDFLSTSNDLQEEDSIELPGPLEEIDFWRKRCENLENILTQFTTPGVRKVMRIMEIIKSPFIPNLKELIGETKKAFLESKSNLHFLKILIEPCTNIQHAKKLEETYDLIDKMLKLILIIWYNSPHYNTKERINGILRKFTNEIINKCRKEVKVEQVFEGLVTSAEAGINSCLKILKFWKKKYFAIEKMHGKHYPKLKWLPEYDVVFVRVDMFLQRLENLLEICKCQRLYGRRSEGVRKPLPRYPGVKGKDVTRVMKHVQNLLDQNLKETFKHRNLILNVGNEQWLNHMLKFEGTIENIEMRTKKALLEAFDSIGNIEQGIQLLAAFHPFYGREIIRKAIKESVVKLYNLLGKEIRLVRTLFSGKVSPLPLTFPEMGGLSMWVLFLQRRVDKQMALIKEASWLPPCEAGEEIQKEASLLSTNLKKYSDKTHQKWITSLSNTNFSLSLQIPLITRSTYQPGMLDINFDKLLAKHLAEAEIFVRLKKPIPQTLQVVFIEKDRLHNLKETVILIVKDYNDLLSRLSPEERLLFQEKIRVLDRKIYPFLTSLTWSLNLSADLVQECLNTAHETKHQILDYKRANFKIGRLLIKISSTYMTNLDSVTEPMEMTYFLSTQDGFRNEQLLLIAMEYKQITVILLGLCELFSKDGAVVRNQWVKYLKKIDRALEEALLLNVRKSLSLLLTKIQGLTGNFPKPIFKVCLKLSSNIPNFSPSVTKLEEILTKTFEKTCIVFSPFPRISQFLFNPVTETNNLQQQLLQLQPIQQVLLGDKTCLDTQKKISEAVKLCVIEMEKYLNTWKPYRDLWELSKETFLFQYEKRKPNMKSYETDISRYNKISDVIQGVRTLERIGFCLIDCSELKSELRKVCKEWQILLQTSLSQKGNELLDKVYLFMSDSLSKLKDVRTESLSDLLAGITTLMEVKGKISEVENSFPQISEAFEILVKCKFQGGTKFNEFSKDLKEFTDYLQTVKTKLKTAKENMKTATIVKNEEITKNSIKLVEEFQAENWTEQEKEEFRKTKIRKFRDSFNKLYKEGQDNLKSAAVFHMETIQPNRNLQILKKEISKIETILGVIPDVSDEEKVCELQEKPSEIAEMIPFAGGRRQSMMHIGRIGKTRLSK